MLGHDVAAAAKIDHSYLRPLADLSAQVGAAAAAGALAGARINADLVEEDTDTALAIYVSTTDASAAVLVPH